ncbi:MAG: ShlB/FhaC/HecB family hemolysin secretion/activation protein [Pseudomonadota bacterium]
MKRWSAICLLAFAGFAGAATEKLDVMEIRVLGNTRLPALAIETAVYPYAGPGKSIEDVEGARQSLETAYRLAGYSTVYVDIPEQTVDGGVVRLVVTEGRLARVRVEGAKYFSARRIRAALPGAKAGEVPNIPELQRDLAVLNTETADRSVVPVLAAGGSPGTVDLTLRVEDKLPLRAVVEVNDQYTADTTRWRVSTTLGYDNLFDRFDSVSLTYQTAPEEAKETRVLAASYVTRWGRGERNRFALTYIDSDSDVASIGTIGVLGAGTVINAQLIFPLVNQANSAHSLFFGAAFKDSDEFIDLGDPLLNLKTPIKYVGLSLGHDSSWRVPKGDWSLSSSINFGLRPFNDPEEFANKRYQGRPNYFYLRAAAAHRREFGSWLQARVRVSGQYAVEPIISNEQFALGGAQTVRGYLEASELGDVGIGGSFEFGLQPRRLLGERSLVEPYLFYDAGIVAVIEPLPGEDRRVDLASVGFALNLGFFDTYSASISWAYPLVPSGRTDAGDSRFLFMMRSSW